MLYWYYKANYNLGQFFFSLKRHIICDGESIILVSFRDSRVDDEPTQGDSTSQGVGG